MVVAKHEVCTVAANDLTIADKDFVALGRNGAPRVDEIFWVTRTGDHGGLTSRGKAGGWTGTAVRRVWPGLPRSPQDRPQQTIFGEVSTGQMRGWAAGTPLFRIAWVPCG